MADTHGEKQLRALARRLTAATQQGTIHWEETGSHAFSYSTDSASVWIASKDEDGLAPFVLEVHDRSGALVERLEAIGGTHAVMDVEPLYHAARRQATNADAVLNELMEGLPADPDPFDGEPF